MRPFLVIGGGPAGLAAALILADSGRQVILVEKNTRLGGKPSKYNCKALEGKCRRCGACIPAEMAFRAEKHPRIEVYCQARIEAASADEHGITAEFSTPEGRHVLEAAGAVVASGFDLIDASVRGEFGYGLLEGVITSADLERKLKQAPDWDAALGTMPRMAFIQCFCSREQGRGVPYCSRICCLYTEKMASLLALKVPGSTIDVFYMDRQVYDPVYQAGDGGAANYIRALPSRVEAAVGQGLRLRWQEMDSISLRQSVYDWVVLCPAVVPGRETTALAHFPGLKAGDGGFLVKEERRDEDKAPIIPAGSCTGPMSILESMASGRAAAARLLSAV